MRTLSSIFAFLFLAGCSGGAVSFSPLRPAASATALTKVGRGGEVPAVLGGVPPFTSSVLSGASNGTIDASGTFTAQVAGTTSYRVRDWFGAEVDVTLEVPSPGIETSSRYDFSGVYRGSILNPQKEIILWAAELTLNSTNVYKIPSSDPVYSPNLQAVLRTGDTSFTKIFFADLFFSLDSTVQFVGNTVDTGAVRARIQSQSLREWSLVDSIGSHGRVFSGPVGQSGIVQGNTLFSFLKVLLDPRGGYFFTARLQNAADLDDIYVVLAHYDSQSALEWSTSYSLAGAYDPAAIGLVFDSTGKILVGTDYPCGGNNCLGVQRFNLDGTRDLAFGDHGVAILDPALGGSPVYRALAVASSGKIFVSGTGSDGGTAFHMVARLSADGKLEEDFFDSGYFVVAGDSFDLRFTGDQRLVSVGSCGVGFCAILFDEDQTTYQSFTYADLQALGAITAADGSLLVVGGDSGGSYLMRFWP